MRRLEPNLRVRWRGELRDIFYCNGGKSELWDTAIGCCCLAKKKASEIGAEFSEAVEYLTSGETVDVTANRDNSLN